MTLFSFAKHRLRLDLCEIIQRKVAERPGTKLAEIGAALGERSASCCPAMPRSWSSLGWSARAGCGT